MSLVSAGGNQHPHWPRHSDLSSYSSRRLAWKRCNYHSTLKHFSFLCLIRGINVILRVVKTNPGLPETHILYFSFFPIEAPPLNFSCPADLLAVKCDPAAMPASHLVSDLSCELPEKSGEESSAVCKESVHDSERGRERLGLSVTCAASHSFGLSLTSFSSQSSWFCLVLHLVTVLKKKYLQFWFWYACGKMHGVTVTIVCCVVSMIESTKRGWHPINKWSNLVQ